MNHIASLQNKLRKRKIDALIVSNPENRRFLCGYTAHQESISESTGHLLILAKGPYFLLTDSRFKLQAERECPDFELLIYRKGFFRSLRKILIQLGARSVGFESDYFLHAQALQLHDICRKVSISLLPTVDLVSKMRLQKTKVDIVKIKKSVALNEKVFRKIFRRLKPGMTEINVAIEIESMMRALGAERPSFSTIVASGPNGALPHATPGHRPIKLNEPVVIDMGLVYEGLCSDMTRTIILGTPDKFTRKIFGLVRQAQLKAAAKLKPLVSCASIDKIARTIIKKEGYGKEFGHSLGHGVGYAVHEAPSLSGRSHQKLLEGMVVTIEPGIYIPGWGGVRLENMYRITKNGSQLFNRDSTCLDIGTILP